MRKNTSEPTKQQQVTDSKGFDGSGIKRIYTIK